MTRVSLVATIHEEQGLANVSELLAILERIGPEVIFLEIPSTAFDDYLDGTRSNLESTAATLYRASHHVELVPVDLPTPAGEFFKNNQYLYERIEKMSPEYCRLVDWHSHYVRTYGFAYLNSERYSELASDLHEATLAAIRGLGDHRLIELHELWKHTNELRDKAMMKHIQDYCAQNTINYGALLVGAAHKQSIIDMSRNGRGAGPTTIQWEVFGFPDGTNRPVDGSHDS